MPARSEQRSRKSPFFWIAIGIGTLIALMSVLLAVSFYVGKTKTEKKGALATAEGMIVNDPDSVILKEDPASGWIYYKLKSTGKLMRMRINPESRRSERELVSPGDPDAPDPNAPPLK